MTEDEAIYDNADLFQTGQILTDKKGVSWVCYGRCLSGYWNFVRQCDGEHTHNPRRLYRAKGRQTLLNWFDLPDPKETA